MQWETQHQPRFDAIATFVPSDTDTLLDVGAEPFHLTRHLVRAAPDADVAAIGQGDGHETVRVGDTDVQLARCNAETDRWPFDEDSMDVVVMGAILEHLFDPLAALEEARRVCQPDGRLVLSTPNATRLIQRARMALGRNPFDGFSANRYHRHQHEWTLPEVRETLPYAGWEIAETATPMLNRAGAAGAMYRVAGRVLPGCSDQLVVAATPTAPRAGTPSLYRESVVERHEDSETTAPAPTE